MVVELFDQNPQAPVPRAGIAPDLDPPVLFEMGKGIPRLGEPHRDPSHQPLPLSLARQKVEQGPRGGRPVHQLVVAKQQGQRLDVTVKPPAFGRFSL